MNRAFSFNKTPTGSKLKRAMSSMISPIAPRIQYHQPHQSSSVAGSTPSGDLQNLRLASNAKLIAAPNNPSNFNSGPVNALISVAASTANLLAPSESPKSSRGILSRMRSHQSTSMMPPPSLPFTNPFPGNVTPKRGMTSVAPSPPISEYTEGRGSTYIGDKQSNDNGENGFTLPKTPTLANKCSRRPSFKFRSSVFIGGNKNK